MLRIHSAVIYLDYYLERVLYEVHTTDYVQRRTHNVQDQRKDSWRRHWLKSHILSCSVKDSE